ncbi:MAG: TolC family protein [Oligoflexia bacterium]|nr:TolC family protein [Oligoflexia bacterium]
MTLIKIKIKINFVFILLLAVTATTTTSISTYANEILTWQNCVDELVKNNFELQAERKSVDSSRYLLLASKSGFYPQLNANVGYTYEEAETTFSNRTSSTTNTTNNYSMSLTASENLFSGLQDYAKIQKADASLKIAIAKYDLLRARLSYDLKVAYTELLYTQKLLTLDQEIVNRRQENLSLVELKFEGGRENKGAVLLSKANSGQAKFDLLQNKYNLQVARLKLAKIIGRDDDKRINFSVDEGLKINEPSPLFNNKLNNKLNNKFNNQFDKQFVYKDLIKLTPNYMKLFAEEKLAVSNLKLAQSTFFPSLNLTGSIGRQDNRFDPKNDRWSIGVSLSFPLFSGGKDYYSAKSAVEEVVAVSAKRKDMDLQLINQLNEAYTKYFLSVEKYKVDQEYLEAVIVRAKIVKSKYNNGLISFDDWDTIENDLISRQKNVLQSYKERIIAEAYWEEVQGKGVIP